MRRINNIILVDYKHKDNKDFLDSINKATGKSWRVLRCISSLDRSGIIANTKRYIKYFVFPFQIFLRRKSYGDIIAWQQFYGLIYAFYCSIFHVRKQNKLLIMTFIYKPKAGIVGKLYYSFIRYIVHSSYIDKIICFSSQECLYYTKLFNAKKDKFEFIQLGEVLLKPPLKYLSDGQAERDYILSIGYSNRDFDFLIDILKDSNYKVKIYSGKNLKGSDNIHISSEFLGKKAWDVISRCRCLAIPLKDTNIAAGNLTILHAMQLGKPVIVTDSKGIYDTVTHGENGFIVPNDKGKWLYYINQLYSNEDVYNSMCQHARKRYNLNHTMEAMGKAIGNLVVSIS